MTISPQDKRNAEKAGVHIIAARSAPHRAGLELTQAENFARLIRDTRLRETVRREIRTAKTKGKSR